MTRRSEPGRTWPKVLTGALLLLGLAVACQTYGRRPVDVTLTTQAQDAAAGAPTDSALEATAYVIDARAWLRLKGKARFTAMETALAAGRDDEAKKLREELLVDLIPYRERGSRTPVKRKVDPRQQVFVAQRGSAIQFREFNPLQTTHITVDLR